MAFSNHLMKGNNTEDREKEGSELQRTLAQAGTQLYHD